MSVKLRRRRLPSGKIRLYLAIDADGHRHYQRLKLYLTGDREQNRRVLDLAEKIRATRELQVSADAEGLPIPGAAKLDFFEFATAFYADKKPQTQGTYKNALDHLRKFTGRELTFERLTPRLCEQYRNYLVKNLRKQNSAGAYFARFKTIIKRAIRDGIIQRDPALGISIRTEETLPKFLTLAQLHALQKAECGNAIVREAFLFSCNTGMRFQDVHDLRWSQIQEGYVRFRQSKTGQEDRLPLTESALTILQRIRALEEGTNIEEPARNDTVFHLPRRSTVDKVLKHWGDRAGIGMPLSFHKARHTFATLALSHKTDLYTVSRLLGHKGIETTQIYAKVTDAMKDKAIKNLPKIGG